MALFSDNAFEDMFADLNALALGWSVVWDGSSADADVSTPK